MMSDDDSDNYLKHCVPRVQFKYDAADTPDITWIRPAQLCSNATQSNIVTYICKPHHHRQLLHFNDHFTKQGLPVSLLSTCSGRERLGLLALVFYRPDILPANSVKSLKCNLKHWFTRPQTVTHPSTNWVSHRVTLLIETNALPLSQPATVQV